MTALSVFLGALAEALDARLDGSSLVARSHMAEADLAGRRYANGVVVPVGPRPEAQLYVEPPMQHVRVREPQGSTEWRRPGNRFVGPRKVHFGRFGVKA